MEELFRFINVSCETSRFYLRNFSFMFGRGELIAISSDTTSAKDTSNCENLLHQYSPLQFAPKPLVQIYLLQIEFLKNPKV